MCKCKFDDYNFENIGLEANRVTPIWTKINTMWKYIPLYGTSWNLLISDLFAFYMVLISTINSWNEQLVYFKSWLLNTFFYDGIYQTIIKENS